MRRLLCPALAAVTAMLLLAAPAGAQMLPSDAQMAAALDLAYNHLGLIEYCADKGFADAGDVANMRRSVKITVGSLPVPADAAAQEAGGRRGEIVGPQVIGLYDVNNRLHPESVKAAHRMTLAANASAQKSTERELCRQMAAQAAPLR